MKTNQSDAYYFGSEAYTLLIFLTSKKFMIHVKLSLSKAFYELQSHWWSWG